MKSVYELLHDFNPWWSVPSFRPPQSLLSRRIIFDRLLEFLRQRQILAISGLRRIGKTTLLMQLIGHLLEERYEGKRIAYFSFEAGPVENRKDTLEEVLYSYCERVLKKKIFEIDERVYMFLDELQYIPGWQDVLKRFYDSNIHVHFIISGSSSLFIGRGSKESLAGRIFDIAVPPFSFNEFLALKKERFFPTVNILGDLEGSLGEIDEAMAASSMKAEELFTEYIVKGQFPEAIEFPATLLREYFGSSIIAKVLEIDIPRLFHIRGIEEIKALFYSACRESGQLFQAVSWSQESGLSLSTIEDYLSYLRQAYLLSLVSNYSGSLRKGPRTLRKLYVSSPNFITGLQGIETSNPLFSQVAGMLVETAVYNRFCQAGALSFWRMREKEIDFILTAGESVIPVEVKYRKTIKPRDLTNLKQFMSSHGLSRALLVTANETGRELHEGREIFKIPAIALL
jgi:uncharacterized protein